MTDQRPPADPRPEGLETVTVSRRFRRGPGGWWWGALLGVPLLLALPSACDGPDGSSGAAAPATSTTTITPTATDTATSTETATSTDTASATDTALPTDGATATEGTTGTAVPTDGSTATDTATATATDGTRGATPTPSVTTVTVTATPSSSATSTVSAAQIGCSTFNHDVAGILRANPIQFVTGGTSLTRGSRGTVSAVAQALGRCGTKAVVVTGYTDNVGSAAVNEKVSAARAAAVRQALVADGVPASRIASAGAGQANPVADNGTDQGRAANRRVEIVAN